MRLSTVVGGVVFGMLAAFSCRAQEQAVPPPSTRTVPVAGDLQDVRIVRHFFTTGITSTSRYSGVTRPDDLRMVVLVLEARIPQQASTVQCADWVLAYRRGDGRYDRATCDGIAAMRDSTGGISSFVLGEVPRVRLNPGRGNLALVFNVESDVDQVELYRIGQPQPLTYSIGSGRKYSVFMTTNRDPARMNAAAQAVREGGYDVVELSTRMQEGLRGTAIFYQKHAAEAAADIARRIDAAVGVKPKVEPVAEEFASEIDVVVRFGQ